MPVLWVSADNDHFFGPQLTARFADAFSKAGGHVDFVGVPPFGDDGHRCSARAALRDLVADSSTNSSPRTISCCATG